ncbi:hypothetical protein [Paenibacillus sacheonensis]|uniref:Uncharacterized protein n=1 Tax=Paenibacillus sacheonensis TaxID=742054 RepID=A0A7X4YPQ6_9BACL|nr:hypothetical protein [Paenibacillus sacheonensis]MBM7564969.1 Na+-transporting methylmalonyl-CoA/oxaloacetate decarboxylase gamma subunit [Paenibacillus sacheonensis]NBC70243.1 hypothetical protein [Paenibacillus sacheonensis]
MGKNVYSRAVGIVLGSLTILAALGSGFLYLLGTSVGKALQSEADTSAADRRTLVALAGLLVIGVLTGTGSLGINTRLGKVVYMGFCWFVGIGLLAAFVLSIGALGDGLEGMIGGMGMLYILLGYLVHKEK